MEVFTIGFTKTPAADFFDKLKQAGVKRLLDVRLNNTSQLAAYAKRDDLKYFLKTICKASYEHEPLLAPTKKMLDDYKKYKGTWEQYEEEFLALMSDRKIESQVERATFESEPTVLLCSELTAEHCHRRLVLDYLEPVWPDLSVVHL